MDRVFALGSLLVMPFWLLMIFAPRWRWTVRLAASPYVVAGPVLAYAALVLPSFLHLLPLVARPKLPEIVALLGQPYGTTVAWMHFLALDLFAARFIYLDARERGLSSWLVSPLLALTLLFGPLGLGVYLALRGVRWGGARKVIDQVRAGSPALLWVTVASLALLVVTLGLQQLDGRVITGAPAWVKPAKFAASVASTAPFLAWILAQLPRRRGLRRAGGLIAATFALELVVIVVQAARGVPSHFNVATSLDGVLWEVMGTAILVFWFTEGYLLWRTLRHTFATPARTWAIRLGLLAAFAGGGLGFIMPRPTTDQLAALKAGQHVTQIGAHTVGAPDGGPGLPVTHWSTQGGDLRVPHFFGLHALQVLPLLALFLERRRRGGQTRLVVAASGAWVGLMLVGLQQALRGQPVLAPDGLTLGLTAAVLLSAALVAAWAPSRRPVPATV
jgi:hypothetical protein